jgi:hypothetical protein
MKMRRLTHVLLVMDEIQHQPGLTLASTKTGVGCRLPSAGL